MPVTARLLMSKADGSIKALENMTPKDRDKIPTAAFAEDFNKFLEQAIQVAPDIQEVAPAAVKIHSGMTGDFSGARYGELLAYWRQMYNLLDAS